MEINGTSNIASLHKQMLQKPQQQRIQNAEKMMKTNMRMSVGLNSGNQVDKTA